MAGKSRSLKDTFTEFWEDVKRPIGIDNPGGTAGGVTADLLKKVDPTPSPTPVPTPVPRPPRKEEEDK